MQLSRTRNHRGGWRARLAVGTLASSLVLLAAAASWAQTLPRIRESGNLRLGFIQDARPFSYRDASGNPAGYAVALCQKLADLAKSELRLPSLRTEFVQVDADERFGAVQQGRVDLLCAAGATTLTRRENVDFSIPVFLGGVGALMRKDAPEKMRAILAGEPEPYQPRWRASLGQILKERIFAVLEGSTAESWLVDKIAEFDILARIERVASFDAGVERVAERQADVLFADRQILLDAAKRSPSAEDLMVLDRYFTYELFALALARGDDDFRLLVDRSLSRLYRSGEIDAIYAASFGAPDAEAQRFFRIVALPE